MQMRQFTACNPGTSLQPILAIGKIALVDALAIRTMTRRLPSILALTLIAGVFLFVLPDDSSCDDNSPQQVQSASVAVARKLPSPSPDDRKVPLFAASESFSSPIRSLKTGPYTPTLESISACVLLC